MRRSSTPLRDSLRASADFGTPGAAALEKAKVMQEVQIHRKIRQMQQLQELELDTRARQQEREERELLRQELLEAERQRKHEEAEMQKRLVEERRQRNMVRAQDEAAEAKRIAEDKMRKVRERMTYLEDLKQLTHLEKKIAAEMKTQERIKIKQEAERKLKEKIDTFVSKSDDAEQSLAARKERMAKVKELQRLEQMARDQHLRETVAAAEAAVERKKRELELHRHVKESQVEERMSSRDEYWHAKSLQGALKELEAKRRVMMQQQVDEAERRELQARLDAKRERVEAIEQYKQGMVEELSAMRAQMKREEDKVKEAMAAARSTEELDDLVGGMSKSPMSSVGGGVNVRGRTPSATRGMRASRSPSPAVSSSYAARASSARPGTAPSGGGGGIRRAVTPQGTRAKAPVSSMIRPGSAAPGSASRIRAASSAYTSAAPLSSTARLLASPARPSTSSAAVASPSRQQAASSNVETMRQLVEEEEQREREREHILASIADPREYERLLKIFRMERESFKQTMQILRP